MAGVKLELRVAEDEAGLTLAAVLRRHVPGLAWSRARDLCARGKAIVDGQPLTDPAARLAAGQAVVLDEHARDPAPPPVRIVLEDSQLVVIDKPAGVSSVPFERRETGTAMDLVRATWRAAGRRATTTPLLIVHRLDKDTSGLLVYAKTKRAEAALAAQLRTHTAQRTYLCVAHGQVQAGRLASRIVADRGDGLRGTTRHNTRGKEAVTHVKPLENLRGATLCEVRLETGRTHQIRIHLSEAGHPLVGERVYIRDYERAGRRPLGSRRLLLHAAELRFAHPVTGAPVAVHAPPPRDFTAEVERLRRLGSSNRGEPAP
jgi:23S rRNA pseudouridine1911/1915/1917 synthase